VCVNRLLLLYRVGNCREIGDVDEVITMGEFQHGLFGCFDNCGVCIITYFVPCYTQGRIAEKVGEDCLICGLLQLVPIANLIFGAQIRGKVRWSETNF